MKFRVTQEFSAVNRQTGQTRTFSKGEIIEGDIYREDGVIIGINSNGFIMPLSHLQKYGESTKMVIVGIALIFAFLMIYLLLKEIK
jgi:hypothetical protein